MLIGFDLDGTLLDSGRRHGAALRQAGSEFDVQFTDDEVSKYLQIKRDGKNGLEALLSLGVGKAKEIHRRWIQLIECEDLVKMDSLYPDTLAALQRTSSVVVTSRQDSMLARAQVAKLGILDLLEDFIVIRPQGNISKSFVSKNYDFDAIIGDTEVDLQWALDRNIPFYASSFGFRSVAFWSAQNIRAYPSLSEIMDAVERISKR
jgi:phosphoglycolate phosphatase-like HAD superfamily hydrolase